MKLILGKETSPRLGDFMSPKLPSRDLMSMSAADGVQDLLPVQFSEENEALEKDYNDIFFASRRTSKTTGVTNETYFALLKEITRVCTEVSAVHGSLRSTYLSAGILDDNPNAVANVFAANRSNTTADETAIYTKTYVDSIRNNNMHIIRPSEKYKGGYDVMFCGVPTGNAMGATAGPMLMRKFRAGRDWPKQTRYSTQEPIELRATNSVIGKAALEAVIEFYNVLFKGEGTTVSSSTSRVMKIVPLDFDFAAAMEKVAKKLDKISPQAASIIHQATAIAAIPSAISKGLGKYVSLLVTREPNREAVNRKFANDSAGDDDLKLSPEELMFNSDISYSFVLHLPQPICEFITQTNNKHIPMVPINTWASIWVRAMIKIPGAKNKGGDRITPRNAPRYVLPASQIEAVNGRRKALGFYQEPGRTNEDNICVGNNGRLAWTPKSADATIENAKAYEQLLEEALQLSYDAGTPLNSNQQGVTDRSFAVSHKDYGDKIESIKKKLSRYTGTVQAVSWDYNCVLTVSADNPERLVSTKLAGATTAGPIGISQILETPAVEALQIQFPSMADETGERIKDPRYLAVQPSKLLSLNVFKNLFSVYQYLLWDGKVPTFQALVEKAAKALTMTTLDLAASTDNDSPQQYEKGLYTNYIQDTLKVVDAYNLDVKARVPDGRLGAQFQTDAMKYVIGRAMDDAAARPGSNLLRVSYATGAGFEINPRYLNLEFMPLSSVNNIYTYLGGQILLQALIALQKVSPKELMVVNTDNPFLLTNFNAIADQVMPLANIFGKYVPDHEKLKEAATIASEALVPDTSIGPDDIKLPGSGPDFKLFPHQLECQQTLRRKPKFAILDVAPGGGKTVSLLLDIGQLIGEGQIKRACVICPDNLMKNWIEDMHKVSQGKWNIIPICRLTYASWGAEKIEEMIEKAPRNTLYVIGMNFFRLQKYNIVLGSHVEVVSAALEFIRKFEFDYVAIDESHRTKNTYTILHRAVRQLTTASCVKFVRLATGSLISNKLTDIVGQSAVMTAQIFRTADEYEADNMVRAADGSKAMVWREDTPARARKQMAKFAAVMTFKKKHWAFLLPNPVQHFMSVALHKNQEIDADGNKRNPLFVDDEIGDAHQALYESVLKETLTEMTKDDEIVKLLKMKKSKAEDTAEDDDGADGEDGDDDAGDADIDGDISEDSQSKLEALLEPYLQRLEQLLSDPMGDPLGKEAFSGLDSSRIVSNKVLLAIQRIKLNFSLSPWEKGKVYHFGGDFADFNGKRYVIYDNGSTPDSQYDLGYKSVLDPDKDIDHWKEESFGKVIVFCRYTRTTEAVYKALPPELKKIAFMFHGGCADRYENLDRFKKDAYSDTKGMQICIANEQAITEGHNLQMASRQIRMESPWAPGDLDQATARIFRPDVSGKFKRENVYIDWILANGTMEVAKFARLISKIIVKAKFDEADNPNYKSIQGYQLPTIRMGLDIFKSQPSLSDVSEYTNAYNHFDSIQRTEFAEMRAKKDVRMIEIPQAEMFKDSKIIEQVPYLPGLNVPDRHNMGLIALKDYMESEDPKVKAFVKEKGIIGLPVHTEQGNGIITKVSFGKQSRAGTMTRVEVTLTNGDVYKCPPSMLWIATKVDQNTIKQFSPVRSTATKRDKERATKRDAAAERAAAREERRLERLRVREEKELSRLKDKLGAAKPGRTRRTKEPAAAAVNYVDVYPTIYNGYWALEAVLHDDAVGALDTDHGYRTFSDYAWVIIKDHPTLDAVVTFLGKKFKLSSDTLRRITGLQASFQGRGKKFMPELFPVSSMKNFLKVSHNQSGIDDESGKPIVKIYPTILNNGLMLNIDIATSPAIKRVLNKTIPNTTAKLQEAEGLHIKFFNSQKAILNEIEALKTAGLSVTNEAEAIKQINGFKFKTLSK